VNTKKVSFNQIGSLVAQVVDAKALGVSNSKDTASEPKGRRQAQEDEVDSSEQNKMVKVTETYNPTTKVAEDKTLEVVFTRTTNTQTTELQTGMDTYVATAEDITVERLTDEPGRVVIKNVANHEFRALNGDIVLQDWTSGNQETIEFLFTKLETGTFTKVATAPDLDINALIQPDSPAGQIILTNNPDYEFRLMNGETELIEWKNYTTDTITFEFDDELTPTIEARGVDATIIFDAIQGLTYDVSLAGVPVLSDIVDNGSLDEDATAGKITLSGLTEGLTYDIAFEGQLPDAALTDITIESRSTDASISFTAFEGFTYAIKTGENTLLSNVVDNDTNDLNEKEGVITIGGLTEGMPYEAHYSGYVVIETITQDEVDGQVDKLFVLYEYTFISFVPLNLNQRPISKDLILDYDNVPLYDKSGFYSDSTRQSFVVDNQSGNIYRIENINITNLSGGCIQLKDNPYPFDLKITEDQSLSFYSLFQNPSITMMGCIKDKYGRKYINNDKINDYDGSTKTQYYVPGHSISTSSGYNGVNRSNPSFEKYAYWLTSKGEVIRTELLSYYLDYKKLTPEGVLEIDPSDNFEVFVAINDFKTLRNLPPTYLNYNQFIPKMNVNNGVLYFFYGYLQPNIPGNYFRQNERPVQRVLFKGPKHSEIDDLSTPVKENWNNLYELRIMMSEEDFLTPMANLSSNVNYLEKYGIIIIYKDSKFYYYNNYWENHFLTFTKSQNQITYTIASGLGSSSHNIIEATETNYWQYVSFKLLADKKPLSLLDGASFENGKIAKVTISGNVYYELYPEFINGEWIITPFVSGTYVSPQTTTVTFQPIN
jgi:hypothetical protein